MKRYLATIVLFLAVASVLAISKQEAHREFMKANKECNTDPATFLDVHGEEVKKWLARQGKPPANTAAHTVCVCKYFGWLDNDGKIVRDAVRRTIAKVVSEDQVDQITDECAVNGLNDISTAENLFKCFLDIPDFIHQ